MVDHLRMLGCSEHDDGLLVAALAGTGYSAMSSTASVRVVTGFDDVDRVTGGGLGAGVHLFSGETGCGRTGLAVKLALNTADAGNSVIFVCSRDESVAVAQRMISAFGRIDRAHLVERAEEYSSQLDAITQRLAEMPLMIVEADQLELWSIGWALRELASKADAAPHLLIIDDLDQLDPKDGDHSILGQVGRSLRDLARSLEIAVVTTTTAAAPAPDRPDRRPIRRDATGWGQMAPYLRTAWLIYRDDMHVEDSPDRGTGELILTWQANGPTGTVKLAHLPHLGTWANLHRRSGADRHFAHADN